MKSEIAFIFVFIISTIHVFAQNPENKNAFPDSWLGNYHGKMYIIAAKSGLTDSVDVEFNFLKTEISNHWSYRMTYHSNKYGDILKDYELIKPDSLAKNSYLIDEKDGILIMNTLMGNCLYSNFIVSGSLICCTLRKEKKDLYFEIFTAKDEYSLSTQNSAKNNEETYIVDSYPPFSTQFVRFIKVDSADKSK